MAHHRNRRAARRDAVENTMKEAKQAGFTEEEARKLADAVAKEMTRDMRPQYQKTMEANLARHGDAIVATGSALAVVANVVPVYGQIASVVIAGATAATKAAADNQKKAVEADRERTEMVNQMQSVIRDQSGIGDPTVASTVGPGGATSSPVPAVESMGGVPASASGGLPGAPGTVQPKRLGILDQIFAMFRSLVSRLNLKGTKEVKA